MLNCVDFTTYVCSESPNPVSSLQQYRPLGEASEAPASGLAPKGPRAYAGKNGKLVKLLPPVHICTGKMHQIQFLLGLCLRPRWGSLQCSPKSS